MSDGAKGPDPADVQKMQAGLKASDLIDFLGPWREKREREVHARVFSVLKDGKPLAGDVAIHAWLELFQIDRMDADLRKTAKTGQIASKRIGADTKP